jgi:hypothetical protein
VLLLHHRAIRSKRSGGGELLPHRDYPSRAAVERLVAHLHDLGARPLAEFLAELAAEHGIAEEITAKLDAWRRVHPDLVHAVGGDRFASPPIRVAGGGQ